MKGSETVLCEFVVDVVISDLEHCDGLTVGEKCTLLMQTVMKSSTYAIGSILCDEYQSVHIMKFGLGLIYTHFRRDTSAHDSRQLGLIQEMCRIPCPV